MLSSLAAMRRTAALALLVITACAPNAGTTTTVPATTTIAPTTTVPGDRPPCLTGDLAFAGSGPIATVGDDSGDATTLAGIRWEGHEGCERLVLDFFSAGGAPASTIGPAGAIALAESGVVRVALPSEIAASAVATSLIDGDLAAAAYVARSTEGPLFVDIHLSSDSLVEARAFTVSSPLRLVIDLRPGEGPSPVIARPSVGDGTVLLAPAPGAALYPLRVIGYATPGIDAIRVRIYQAGAAAVDRAVSTFGPDDTWHAFDVRLADGPSGPAELFVGPVDAFEEPDGGVTVPLELP